MRAGAVPGVVSYPPGSTGRKRAARAPAPQPRGVPASLPPTCGLLFPPAASANAHLVPLRLRAHPARAAEKPTWPQAPSPTALPNPRAPPAAQHLGLHSRRLLPLRSQPLTAGLLRAHGLPPSVRPRAPRASLLKQRTCTGGCAHAGRGLRPASPGLPRHTPPSSRPAFPEVDLDPTPRVRRAAARPRAEGGSGRGAAPPAPPPPPPLAPSPGLARFQV